MNIKFEKNKKNFKNLYKKTETLFHMPVKKISIHIKNHIMQKLV